MANSVKFFNDLHSTDSAKYAAAYEFLESGGLNLDPSDVNLLLAEATTEFPADSLNYRSVNELLIQEIRDIADESNIELLISKYLSFDKDLDKYRYELLDILAKIQSGKSFSTIDSLLLLQIPTHGDATAFVRRLQDSAELSIKILSTLL